MATETSNILESFQLSIGYREKQRDKALLEPISFQCEKGTLVGIVGANGVGKSTLLRTLSGMQQPLSGSVLIGDKNINDYHPVDLATKVSVVLTEAPSSKNLSVLEFVSLGRQPHTNWIGNLTSNDKRSIEGALELTHTTSLANRKCFELSDGQMQRVAIARALAQDTPLILLDEPTTHLDIYHRASVLKLLKSLSKNMGKTIVFSTHEIDLAIQLSDSMLVLSENGYHFGDPCRLIEEHRFTDLFPKDTVVFDEKTGRFTIKD